MTRSDALKKAQKKYLLKIKEENTEVYKSMMKKQLLYQKQYIKKLREDEEKFNNYKKGRADYARIFYNNNKQNILDKRAHIREIKKDEDLNKLLQKQIN
ncbi:hypothetical protein CPAV1605_1474 [seawater metagenome]|uniref:Uncharacterized protein n=1 Tax=seawater metagenome TaxID=1561972 RepID=A0A5E8CLD1_9ZZZZ